MYVPAISDTAHRTLAIASDSAKTQCPPMLPDSETYVGFRGLDERRGVVMTAKGPARAAGALVKASTGPTILSDCEDVGT